MTPQPFPRKPLSALRLALVLAGFACHHAAAVPYPRDQRNAMIAAGYGYLLPRQDQCHQPCGYQNMYCCEAGTQCYTSDGIAGCSAYAGGGWAWYTTTWTVTQTFTRTYNSWIPAATGPDDGGDCVPPPGSGQIACGKICCASWQYCAHRGQCMANNQGPLPVPGPVPTTYTSDGVTITTQFSPPWRVTSSTLDGGDGPTPTADDPAASDTAGIVVPGDDPTTEEGGGGLSGGAIAGIVIGALAGVALLLLLCVCCAVRGLWHGMLAVLGFGKKKNKGGSDSSSDHSRRDNHSSWYGGRPSSAGARSEKKKGAGLLGLGALLGTLALLLGLKRDGKKRQGGSTVKSRSDVSSSYFSESYTGTSSRSSDRRTRRSRRSSRHSHSRTPSRVTRTTHTTHTHTRLSRAPSARSARSPRSPRP
ncbi:hypothetical protein VTJ83DRAFT_2015 [Remersonia thermophila]|uniref:Uncharacterized protein n=1 Tax=Remersonia thermophila TaxID=72144 RepID=A0ABR4DHS2_9PEZI